MAMCVSGLDCRSLRKFGGRHQGSLIGYRWRTWMVVQAINTRGNAREWGSCSSQASLHHPELDLLDVLSVCGLESDQLR